jgi:thiol-disulfide isomerase/thioredoxin
MRKSVLSLAVVFVGAAVALAGPGKYNKKVSVGEKAPMFTGIPAVMGSEEASISLPDIKEDVVILTFLGNHCPVVVAYEDRIIDIANMYKGKSVRVVGVSVNDNNADRLPAIKDRVKEKGYNYVYGFDETQKIGRDYGATNTPQFFVLDKDRVIRYMGALDDSQNSSKVTKTYLKDAVDALLAGKEPPVTETQPKGCGVQYKR